MAIQRDKYWIRITPDFQTTLDDGDGKWVVFLRRNYHQGPDEVERQSLLRHIQWIINHYSLRGALVTASRLDVSVFFTSADRDEIWRTKQLLMRELNLRARDMIWKANFETDLDWEEKKGALWYLDEIDNAFVRKERCLRQGRLGKAERIQRKDIDRLMTEFKRSLLEESVMNRRSMVITPPFTLVDYEIDPKLLFVLMPFSEEWSNDVYYVVKQVAESVGLHAVRADDIFEPNIVVDDIWKMINKAGLIVADITVHNANVFYELGIAHAIGKKVVLIRQEGGARAPFDVAFWRYFEYGLSPIKIEQFKDTLTKIFQHHISIYTDESQYRR